MPKHTSKHPVIRGIAYLAVTGGIAVLALSLLLLHGTLKKQHWTPTPLLQSGSTHYYQVGEKRYQVTAAAIEHAQGGVFYNPTQPDQYITLIPSYWWNLYLVMAGLIVLYAGLHLLQERDRNVQSLGFE